MQNYEIRNDRDYYDDVYETTDHEEVYGNAPWGIEDLLEYSVYDGPAIDFL